MKAKTLSLGFALILCFLAAFAGGPLPSAEASCPPDFCAVQQQDCQGPCAIFFCKQASCWASCSYPIVCLD